MATPEENSRKHAQSRDRKAELRLVDRNGKSDSGACEPSGSLSRRDDEEWQALSEKEPPGTSSGRSRRGGGRIETTFRR